MYENDFGRNQGLKTAMILYHQAAKPGGEAAIERLNKLEVPIPVAAGK